MTDNVLRRGLARYLAPEQLARLQSVRVGIAACSVSEGECNAGRYSPIKVIVA